MIDKVMLNLYECCKCAYQWINWDGINKTEGPMSIACPKCKNVRWNQKYTDNEISVVEQLARQHVIKEIVEFLGSYLRVGHNSILHFSSIIC